jgi:hypothetical protein
LSIQHPYRDGTAYILMAPLELIARLAALALLGRDNVLQRTGQLVT